MIRLGVVTTTGASFTVTVDGASTAVNALRIGAYNPTVGDRIATVQVGAQLLVLGKVV